MVTTYWELKKYYGKKTCGECGRRITHVKHTYMEYDHRLFGPYWELVVEWEKDGMVVAGYGIWKYSRSEVPTCEACRLGLDWKAIREEAKCET